MNDFRLTILGCGSAKPTLRHHTSSQVVSYMGEHYMIDCGEGTQQQLMRFNIRPGKLHTIFISHSHGDHCLGLVGMLASWALTNRDDDVHLYVPHDLENILRAQIDFFVLYAGYRIHIHPINCLKPTIIFEDNHFIVSAFPLDHRIPCFGFLFQEKEGKRHIRPECIQQYDIPFAVCDDIKSGADFVTTDGQVIPNERLTTPPAATRRYAYLSDTRPVMKYADPLQGVDVVYHEATYLSSESAKAIEYYHSTAEGAGKFAAACGAKQLLIGHLSSSYEKNEEALAKEAANWFPNTLLVQEGMVVKL